MNNFELHEAALDLSCGQSAYTLARQLIKAQQRIAEFERERDEFRERIRLIHSGQTEVE